MNKITLLAFLILLLLLSLFIFKAEAEAPEPLIIVPESIQNDDIKSYAYLQVTNTFGKNNWESFNSIIEKESKWDCQADNPKSTAYGLGQLLDGTLKYIGHKKSTDCRDQVDAAIAYIDKVYKTPINAWSFWKKNNWY